MQNEEVSALVKGDNVVWDGSPSCVVPGALKLEIHDNVVCYNLFQFILVNIVFLKGSNKNYKTYTK